MNSEPSLARRFGLFSLIVYGVGDMVGAGIYGTIGVAAGLMGNAVWLAFVISMVAALLTGLSYASLASRYPKAGGAAYITQRAYNKAYLSYVVGLSVAASGLTSMATGANVFARTLGNFIPGYSFHLLLGVFIAVLTVINVVGIKESIMTNLVCTVIEVGGLIFIVLVGYQSWGSVNYLEVPDGKNLTLTLLLSGAVLTFYAFVGFEDMLNVAEEVKRPEKVIPMALMVSLILATVLYILVSITAVSVVPAGHLADLSRGAPLTQISSVAAPSVPAWIYNAITLFAVANTALLNYIMGSRLLYGMARQGLLPKFLGRVHARFHTPYLSILTLGAIVLILAMVGNISQLASATSLLLLSCFCVVNIALFVLMKRKDEPVGEFEIPQMIPLFGALVCLGLIIARVTGGQNDIRSPLIAGVIVVFLSVLYYVLKPKNAVDADASH